MIKIIILLLWPVFLFSQSYKIIESNNDFIELEFNFSNFASLKDTSVDNIKFQKIISGQLPLRMPGEPAIPSYSINIGILPGSNLSFSILMNEKETQSGKFIIPVQDDYDKQNKLMFEKSIYGENKYFPSSLVEGGEQFTYRFSRIAQVTINPIQFNPYTRELLIHKKIKLRINYNSPHLRNSLSNIKDHLTEKYLKSSVANYSVAKNWCIKQNKSRVSSKVETYWYNPNKNYYRILLNEKGVYRVTYQQLLAAGLPASEILDNSKLELFCNGEAVPIEIVDNGDGLFNSGDYFQFVGFPPKETPYGKQNIYNTKNVYWFSYQANTSGLRYRQKDGYPYSWDKTFHNSLHTIHYEKDSIYERLGLAKDDKRDYWFWGKAYGDNGKAEQAFTYTFPIPKDISEEQNEYTLRFNLHGMTDFAAINPDHNIDVAISSQPVGTFSWDGQSIGEFEKKLKTNEVLLFESNNIQIFAKGNTSNQYQQTSDEVRINWFEIDYWREFRVNGEYLNLYSIPGEFGKTRFFLYRWKADTMKVYVPQRSTLINNPMIIKNEYEEAYFVDSVFERTEYFCTSDNYFLSPDSIIKNVNSDLRNPSNGADYIIITHPDFYTAAQKLAEFRSKNLGKITNPRIKVVDVNQIYNEFSFGLLDPFAIQDFLSFAFNNWETPFPSYVVLLGDMSWDYRQLHKENRKNFIPSIPYHSIRFGQAVSDNLFAAIEGEDVIPDMAIGRISCETIGEANTLVDKIISYPADDRKEWKEKVLLIGAGENKPDEDFFGFNAENTKLENKYLIPNGYPAKKIFRYPEPEDIQYQGERPEIRQAFNDGCAVANFYGHGGGYQWDFVFLNDDIHLLQNGNKMPFISSVTCYTAHFDNQDVFGEQFNKIPGKGSIGFWGHTGITYWNFGTELNNKLFEQIFNKENYIIGDAIMFAKSSYGTNSQLSRDHIVLLTLLGDPALQLALPDIPDFAVYPSSISISPSYPVVNDTLIIKIGMENLGRNLPQDSVEVKLTAELNDSSIIIGNTKIKCFGQKDSVYFYWKALQTGLLKIKAEINPDGDVNELDLSNNLAENVFTIFNLAEPNIIKPANGVISTSDKLKFVIADIGYYISKSLSYFIELNNSTDFNNPILKSPTISPVNGIAEWNPPALEKGIYYWRVRMLENQEYSHWTKIHTFTIADSSKEGYNISSEQLKLFKLQNVYYSDSLQGLTLNSTLLPPYPSNEKFLEDIKLKLPDDINGLTSVTTDGTYIYFGHIAYYGGSTLIYKMGTGYNGSTKGLIYGPVSPSKVRIIHQMFCHNDGNIYIATGSAHSLLKMNAVSGDTSSIYIPDGLLNSDDGRIRDGSFYLASNGKYVYNLAYLDSQKNHVYTLRIFDPAQNWKKIKDMRLSGTSYLGFSGFFAAGNYLYPYENYYSGTIRKYDLETGLFLEEWISYIPFQGFYTWSYDWKNDVVYASVFRDKFEPKFSKFAGHYKQAFGKITSEEIGPASGWNRINFESNTNASNGKIKNYLEGYNRVLMKWDTIAVNISEGQNLSNFSALTYPYFRINYDLVDSSYGSGGVLTLKNLQVDYVGLPEITINSESFKVANDSSIQGLPLQLTLELHNYGLSDTDVNIKLFLNDSDQPEVSQSASVGKDSVKEIQVQIPTSKLINSNKIRALVSAANEMFTFNNHAEKAFYINKDKEKPTLKIYFDGVEILDGDIVSAKPKIQITLKDNSPLPLNDTSLINIFHNYRPVSFRDDSLKFTFSSFPDSHADVLWDPILKSGKHVLEVLARDASGNYSDSAAFTLSFIVNEKNSLLDVYNFPNPFADDTYFTFNLTGTELPEKLSIKIFTVAGRLIRDLDVQGSSLRFGFNKIFYDGRDQDGNSLANGVYFYKIIAANKNNIVTQIQKLAKVK